METAWIVAARRAKLLLPEKIAHGDKQATMSAVASAVGLTRQSLRNLLAAYDFLERVRELDRQAYDNLSRLPSASVEIYSRWAKYDPAAAFKHAAAAVREGFSTPRVIAAEKLARSDGTATESSAASLVLTGLVHGPQRRARHGDIADLCSQLGASIESMSEWTIQDVTDPVLKAAGVADCIVEAADGSADGVTWPCLVAVLEVGERALAEGYRKEAKSILVRAVASSTRAPLTVVVAPASEALHNVVSALPQMSKAGGTPHPVRAGELLVLRQMTGGIVFTSRERLATEF